MPGPKSEEGFRLFKRRLGGRELFYVRIFDVDGTIITTRSTGASDERKAVKKALETLKSISKSPLKTDPPFVDFLVSFWQRNSDFVQLRELDGHRLTNTYINKTKFYIEKLVSPYEPFKKIRLTQVSPRMLDKWKLAVNQTNESRKGINHAINGMRVPLRWAFSKGYISSDPTLSFKYINYKPKEKGALSLLEMGKIETLD